MDIEKLIKKERTSIQPSSLKAYMISLRKLNNNEKIEDLNYLKDDKAVFEKIDKLALSTKRAYLTAILVVLQAYKKEEFDSVLDIYKKRLQKLNNEYNEKVSSHEKTEKQSKNWTSLKSLNKVRNFYKKELEEKNILKKENLNRKEFDLLQKYLVSALYTLQPPIRLDYGNMEIINNKKDDDGKKNFLLNKGRNKKTFIFNDFKNKKSMGKREIEINSKLNTIINLLRHIYISENIDLEAMKKQKKLADDMLHSADQQVDYAKK